MEGISLKDYERAEAELRAREGRMGFYVHAAIYVLVNVLLLVINLVYVPGVLWFFYPLIGWGIGLTMHFLFGVFWIQRETEEWQQRSSIEPGKYCTVRRHNLINGECEARCDEALAGVDPG